MSEAPLSYKRYHRKAINKIIKDNFNYFAERLDKSITAFVESEEKVKTKWSGMKLTREISFTFGDIVQEFLPDAEWGCIFEVAAEYAARYADTILSNKTGTSNTTECGCNSTESRTGNNTESTEPQSFAM